MDTGGLSHLANFDFDQTGQHVPRYTGLEALLAIQHLRGHELRAPSVGSHSVAGNLPEHESTGYP